MSYNLSCFGWESCIIPNTLKSIQNLVPKWSDLKILRKKRRLDEDGEELRLISNFFYDFEGNPYMPGYTKDKRIDEGTYGNIYLGKRGIYKPLNGKTTGIIHLERDRPMEDICIKEVRLRITEEERRSSPRSRNNAYEDELRIILAEAFLHALVFKVFDGVGLPQRVPKLYEVVGHTNDGQIARSSTDFHSIWMIMEVLRGQTLANYLNDHLTPLDISPEANKLNEEIIVDILIQLADTLSILQTRLRFNHRDMKLNNVFVRHHETDENWIRELDIDGYGKHTCKRDITMLDFGFACIGCSVDNSALISAGSWFDEDELCFKCGRDLCQFIYALNVSFPIDKYVSTDFYNFISKIMTADISGYQVNLLHGVNEEGVPNVSQDLGSPEFNEGIYIFLKNDIVDIPNCEPRSFLNALRKYLGLG